MLTTAAVLICSLAVSALAQVSPGEATGPWPGPGAFDSTAGFTVDEAAVLPIPGAAQSAPAANWRSATAGLFFERNDGQTDPQVKFLARGPGYQFFLTGSEAVLVLTDGAANRKEVPARLGGHGFASAVAEPRIVPGDSAQRVARSVIRMKFAGANPASSVVGERELAGKVNYFIGNDPKRWRTRITTFAQIRYREIYPRVDLVYYHNGRQLEYDFILAPGADPTLISLEIEGATNVAVNDQGDLVLQGGQRQICWRRPQIRQEVNGQAQQVAGAYVVSSPTSDPQSNNAASHVSFQIAKHDPTQQLIIDPALVYSTYLGGSGTDSIGGLATDPQGNAYVAGQTLSPDFPVKGSLQQFTGNEYWDAFITKLSPTGQLVYSTYLGGNGPDAGNLSARIAADPAGNAYVTGQTESNDFPLVNAFQTARNGPQVVLFVAKLPPDGSALLYSTYLGGPNQNTPVDFAVDPAGEACILGSAGAGFPMVNAFQRKNSNIYNDTAFIAKFSASGQHLIFSTYFGTGSYHGGVIVPGVALDDAGNTYIVGSANAGAIPVKNPMQPTSDTGAFVAAFKSDGSELLFSTYVGGTNSSLNAVFAQPGGDLYVAGSTRSDAFPLVHPYQSDFHGLWTGVIARLKPDASSILWSTYFGGTSLTNRTAVFRIAADPGGNVYVAGNTTVPDMPLKDALQTSMNADSRPFSSFVAALSSDGSNLLFGSYSPASTLAVDPSGALLLAGSTTVDSLAVQNAVQSVFGGGYDGYLAKLSPLAKPPMLQVTRVGSAVQITWLSSAGNFTLETSRDLSSPSWQSVPNSPTSDGTDESVTIPVQAAAGYFRLRQL